MCLLLSPQKGVAYAGTHQMSDYRHLCRSRERLFRCWRRVVSRSSVSAPYLLGGVLGGMFSGLLFSRVSVPLLRKAFALLLLWGGVRAVLLL